MRLEESPSPNGPSTVLAEGEFADQLGAFRRELEAELESWLARKDEELTREVGAAAELTSRLSEYVLRGGKRLRPALLYFSYLACGGAQRSTVIPAALAVELLHTYLLIHDDIMDRATTRRGRPTAHVHFREHHIASGWTGDADHHGDSVAILLGDLAHCFAEELFSQAEPGREARACFATMCQEVITGQYLEFTAPQRESLSEEELLQILRMKSGRYSVERPIQLGAHLAGAPVASLADLSRFGLLLGEAFQLHDDLLGMFGDKDRVGKPVGGDLVEGKHTLLVHHALENAGPDEAAKLRAALENPNLTADEIEQATGIIRRTGAEKRVVGLVAQRHEEAAAILAALPLEEEPLQRSHFLLKE